MEKITFSERQQVNEEPETQVPKKIDIFQHLKISLGNSEQNCKCDNSNSYYCVPCKVSVCSNCNLADHLKHTLIKKADYKLNDENINKMFLPALSYIKTAPIYTNTKKAKENLLGHVDDLINELQNKIKRFKDKKVQEIEGMFNVFEKNSANTLSKINQTQDKIKKYLSKNQKFFNTDDNSNFKNTEGGNTLFLMNFDILNIANQASKDIEETSKKISLLLDDFEKDELEKNNKTEKDIEDILFPPSEKQDEEDFNSPSHRFISSCNHLSEEPFDSVDARINKYSSQIDNFKKVVFGTMKKYGNFKEIEKQVNSFESSKQKCAENLFSKRKANGEMKSKTSLQSLAPNKNLAKKDDVVLNNPLLEKYFAYLTIDLYDKNFKMATKELQSSHADLMIKVSDDDDKDVGKAIEGTNEIQIYEKKTGKMFRKRLNLTRNPHGYTKFPIGCRSLLLGDKLYITGGKDESEEYPVVLIYDRKEDKLKRIMDLRIPRSYHTMIFNEVFDTIMVIGGEGESTVEIFDPLTNRWQLLPRMNFARANPYFFFDETRGMMYTMFGNEGKITDNLFSDVIEYLDLTNLREGWFKMDYYNKANVNLKSYLNIYPLNNELILAYGGMTARKSQRTICVINLVKKEVGKVERRLMETLRAQAKQSRRLSSIVSSISLTSSSNNNN